MMTPEGAAAETALLPGRRERKKAATRASISAAALELFLERGFEEVSVRDVADRADVAVATIFAHFSGKEALVFDQDEDVTRSLLATVEQRTAGTDVLDALRKWFLTTHAADQARDADADFTAFRELIDATPALREYWERRWRDHEGALADTIERAAGVEARVARLAATLTIEGYLLAAQDDHPDRTLELLFQILRAGLSSQGASSLADPSGRLPQPE